MNGLRALTILTFPLGSTSSTTHTTGRIRRNTSPRTSLHLPDSCTGCILFLSLTYTVRSVCVRYNHRLTEPRQYKLLRYSDEQPSSAIAFSPPTAFCLCVRILTSRYAVVPPLLLPLLLSFSHNALNNSLPHDVVNPLRLAQLLPQARDFTL